MSSELDDLGHGHSPAAWISVIVMLVAFTVGTVALFVDSWPGFWVGVGLLAVGGALGPILAKAGYGVKGPKYQPKGH
ncbi:MAG: HGxxPAAW family protein [Mycetocola sp.]